MGTQKNRLIETVLFSTQNKCLNGWVKIYSQFYAEKYVYPHLYFSYNFFYHFSVDSPAGRYSILVESIWRFVGEVWLLRLWGRDFSSTHFLLVSSAHDLCKLIGPRSGLTKCRAWSGSNLFDTRVVVMKEFLEKVDFVSNLFDTQMVFLK